MPAAIDPMARRGRGFSPVTTRLADMWGALNIPICCGGAVVMPGDAVLADSGGVYFTHPARLEPIISKTIAAQEMQEKAMSAISRENPVGRLSGASAMVERSIENKK